MTAPESAAADEDRMRSARRRWAGGVAVLLTRDGPDHRGATVGSFAVVSLAPAMVAVCLDRNGRIGQLVAERRSFTVSILDRRQEPLADRFAGRGPLPGPTLDGIAHAIAPSGHAVLADALAWFDCQLREVLDAGDHLLVVAVVETVSIAPDTDDPLLYYEGRYRGIEVG